MSFRNLSIARRATLGFTFIGLLLLLLGGTALVKMNDIRASGLAIEERAMPRVAALDELTAKQAFWTAFRELGAWHDRLPPY